MDQGRDEPTTALDVSVQAQIIDAMKRMYHKHITALMSVTHDIGIIVETVDRLTQIPGSMPQLDAIPSGCEFNPRCTQKIARCTQDRPELIAAELGRVSCWLYDGETP